MTTTITAHPNRRLRRARQAAQLSQGALATAVGCTRATIINIEQGRHRPRADLALRLAAALGTTVERLFGPIAEPQARAHLRRLTADELAAALIDGGDDSIIAWAIPRASLAKELGMPERVFMAERARALLSIGEAIAELRSRGWTLDVSTRHDLSPNAEIALLIEATHIPPEESSR